MASAKKTATPMLDELAAHDERARAASQHARELAQSIAEHGQVLDRLREARIEAYSRRDEPGAIRLKKEAADAAAQSVELEERREGAAIAARAAQEARGRFIGAPRVIGGDPPPRFPFNAAVLDAVGLALRRARVAT